MTDDFDLISIGSGPAGASAAELAAMLGHRVLVIEKNLPGGTVTTTGGAPSKTLREAALYFSGLRERDIYGVRLNTEPELVFDTIRRRTLSVCSDLQDATLANLSLLGVEYMRGTARMGEQRTVLVETEDGSIRQYRGRVVLIACGSHPMRCGDLPENHPSVCDTDTFLTRGRPPKDLLIVGGGAVAVEFATIAHALGIPVTLATSGGRLIEHMDSELTHRLSQLFSSWRVPVLFGATIERATPIDDGTLRALLSTGDELIADTILFAAGRASNTTGLGLEVAGVELDSRGQIRVDSQFRTSAEGIFAAGDVLRPTLASVAMEQGRTVVCHAFGIPFGGIVDPTPVSAVYGMPEVAGAGLTEDECRRRLVDYEVGRSDLGATPRGMIAGRGGLLKLLVQRGDRRILGVHCIGDIASEMVGVGQMAIRCGATLDTISNMSMNTPTYGYAYKYAAFDCLRRLQQSNGSRHERIAPMDAQL